MKRKRFSARVLTARLLAYGGRCAACDCKTGGPAGLEWDHITPLELGGDDEIQNLQPLCRACHKAKTADDVKSIRKAERQRQRVMGVGRQTRSPLPGGKGSRLKRKINGQVVER